MPAMSSRTISAYRMDRSCVDGGRISLDSQCRIERPHLLEVACSADPVSSQRGRITSGLPTTRELTDIEGVLVATIRLAGYMAT